MDASKVEASGHRDIRNTRTTGGAGPEWCQSGPGSLRRKARQFGRTVPYGLDEVEAVALEVVQQVDNLAVRDRPRLLARVDAAIRDHLQLEARRPRLMSQRREPAGEEVGRDPGSVDEHIDADDRLVRRRGGDV